MVDADCVGSAASHSGVTGAEGGVGEAALIAGDRALKFFCGSTETLTCTLL